MLRYWMVCLVVPACFTHWFTDGSPSNLPLSSAGFHQRQFPENNASSTRHHPAAHDRITRGIRTAVSNKPTERCYGTFGCYSVNRPWTSSNRPINNFPEAPEIIQPAFCLYTRHNRSRCQNLVTGDVPSIQRSGLDSSRRILFIVHGYLEHGNKKWIKRMVEEALIYDNVNVVVVDWVSGSGPPYTQAVANIRLIGVMLAHLVLFLHGQFQVPTENCHIAGHSLGAHLAGYTGQYMRDRGHMLGRITGMDPADPYFENTEPLIRLDPTDALFVDVIHTDAGPILSGGLGMMQPIGHIDFYPNGGVRQPGCGTSVLDSIEKERGSVLYGLSRFIGCNHLRSVEFFTESFNSACPFLAVQCPSFADFLAGACHCGSNACHRMGYSADHQSVISSAAAASSNNWAGNSQQQQQRAVESEPIQMYLLTRDDQPFCLYHYRVTIIISDTFESVQHGGDRGWLSIQLHGHNRSSPPTRLTPENVRFEPRMAYSYVLGSTWLGEITSVTLVWTYSSSVFNPLTWRILTIPALHVNRIIVHNLESNSSTVICGEDTAINSKEARQMFPASKCRNQSRLPLGASFVLPTEDTGANVLRKNGKRNRRLYLG
ncbi:pancreatic lipase-related protein 2-like [Daphnia pulicaria]|uniref:pancreatic lipase-related protein 2-like n=1 Tax=Daphnia pulicaria TaxID=35523 RepID=UPI001EEB721C|nr:pancreatic lipase-related protein 2-like [Daphnia pulicaria]